MPTARPITNDDLWSAIRGLGLYGKYRSELQDIIEVHKASDLFASRVIVEAAKQVLQAKTILDGGKRTARQVLATKPRA